MNGIRRGKIVRIRCAVQQGAFPGEVLITFSTTQGPISGFVRREAVEDLRDNSGYIPARVEDVSADTVTVRVHGSFFTTTGLAYFKRDDSNIEPAYA